MHKVFMLHIKLYCLSQGKSLVQFSQLWAELALISWNTIFPDKNWQINYSCSDWISGRHFLENVQSEVQEKQLMRFAANDKIQVLEILYLPP